MLKPLIAKPSAELREEKRTAASLDKATGDRADLRTYVTADGKSRYLRVWVGDPKLDEAGGPKWYEIVDPRAEKSDEELPASIGDEK